MGVAIRSLGIAGLTLTTACAIACSPVTAPAQPVADLRSVAVSVNLAAAADPLALYGDVLNRTGAASGALVAQLLKEPAPILTKIAANQIAYVSGLGSSVFDGFWTALYLGVGSVFYGGGTTTLAQIVSLIPAFIGYYVSQTAEQIRTAINGNLVETAMQLRSGRSVVAGAVTTPFLAGRDGARLIAADIAESVNTGDLASLARAVVDAPAIVVNAVLNGRCGVTRCAHPGLLTPETGTIASVLKFRDSIAGAITPFAGGPFATPAVAVSAKKPAAPSRAGAHTARKASAAAHSKRARH